MKEEPYLSVFRSIDCAIRALLDARSELERILEEEEIHPEIPAYPDFAEFEDPLFHEA